MYTIHNYRLYFTHTHVALIRDDNQLLRSAEKAALQLCKIRESDWCILLDSAKIKSIHQSGSRILQQL